MLFALLGTLPAGLATSFLWTRPTQPLGPCPDPSTSKKLTLNIVTLIRLCVDGVSPHWAVSDVEQGTCLFCSMLCL